VTLVRLSYDIVGHWAKWDARSRPRFRIVINDSLETFTATPANCATFSTAPSSWL